MLGVSSIIKISSSDHCAYLSWPVTTCDGPIRLPQVAGLYPSPRRLDVTIEPDIIMVPLCASLRVDRRAAPVFGVLRPFVPPAAGNYKQQGPAQLVGEFHGSD